MVHQEKLLSLSVGIAVVAMTLSAVGTSSERSERATLAACRKAEQQGQVLRAFSALRGLVKSKHVYIRQEAQFLLGRAYLVGGKRGEAVKTWEALAASNDPKWSLLAYSALGRVYRSKRQNEKALKAYDAFLRSNLRDLETVRAAAAVGAIRLEEKKYSQAVDSYKFALRVANALYEEDQNKLDMNKISQELRLAKRYLTVKVKGEDAVLYEEAEALRFQAKYTKARTKYHEVLARFPASLWRDPSTVGIGRCFLEEWRLQDVKRILLPFVRVEPHGPYRAQALIVLGDTELLGHCRANAALTLFAEAGQPPEGAHSSWLKARWKAEQRQGIALFAIGEMQQAEIHLAAAESLLGPAGGQNSELSLGLQVLRDFCSTGRGPTPAFLLRQGHNDVRLAVVLGDVWRECLDFKRALRTYGLVLDRKRLGARATVEQRVYAKMMCGVCYQNTFQTKKAISTYRELLTEYPSSRQLDEFMFRLGVVTYNQTEQYEEAAGIMFRIAQLPVSSEKKAEALQTGAWIMATKGHLDAAHRVLRSLKMYYPRSDWTKVLEFELQEFEQEGQASRIE